MNLNKREIYMNRKIGCRLVWKISLDKTSLLILVIYDQQKHIVAGRDIYNMQSFSASYCPKLQSW